MRVLTSSLQILPDPFSVALFSTRPPYAAAWLTVDSAGSPPEVDFASKVVIYLGMAGSSSCPVRFQHLVVDEASAHVYGEWDDATPANRPCTDDLAGSGVVLVVSRAVLPQGEFRLTLRQDLICPDCPDHPDQELVSLG
ncbi:MAG TPA: hypothetical protein VM284_04065 [Candidatus Limnocylindria bacterium]|nr:hypothetical protein [Candidatus Limnocylindria bacterium]